MLRGLDERAIESVTTEIVRIGRLPARQRIDLIMEAQDRMLEAGGARGGIEYARALLAQTFGRPTPRSARSESTEADSKGPFASLLQISPEKLAQIIRNEHPQIIAVVLSRFPAGSASRTLQALPYWVRTDVATRMATIQDVSPTVVRVLEEKLRTRVARIVADERVRQMSFADVGSLDERSMRSLLQYLQRRTNGISQGWNDLVTALAGAPLPLVDRICAQLPLAEAQRLRSQLLAARRPPRAAVDAAQEHVLLALRKVTEHLDTGLVDG